MVNNELMVWGEVPKCSRVETVTAVRRHDSLKIQLHQVNHEDTEYRQDLPKEFFAVTGGLVYLRLDDDYEEIEVIYSALHRKKFKRPTMNLSSCPKALRGLNLGSLLRDDGSVVIPLTKGKFALIDLADFPKVKDYRWSASYNEPRWYAKRGARYGNGKSRIIAMHHSVLPQKVGVEVDHRFGDGLDNRRRNLRYATHSQNMNNRTVGYNPASGFRGVRERISGWQAGISENRKRVYLGIFPTAREAAIAYDAKAKELHGEFACLNFPEIQA